MTQLFKLIVPITILFVASKHINTYGSLVYAILVPIVAMFSTLAIFYSVTVRKRLHSVQYNQNFFTNVFIKSRRLPYIVTTVICFIIAMYLPVKLYLMSAIELSATIITLATSIALAIAINKKIYNVDYNIYGLGRSLKFISIMLSIIIYPLLMLIARSYIEIETLTFESEKLQSLSTNAIAYTIANFIILSDSLPNALSQIVANSSLIKYLIELIFLNGLFFYGLINITNSSLLTKASLIDALTPIDKESAATHKFLSALYLTILLIFIYPSLFIVLQNSATEHQAEIADAAKTTAELIDNQTYKVGTYLELEHARFNYLKNNERTDIIGSINTQFDTMVSNVDSYLDWYYGLGAEYSRIFTLITGTLEEYLMENLQKKLAQGAEGSRIQVMNFIDNATKYINEVDAIKAKNILDLPRDQVDIILKINSAGNQYAQSDNVDFIGLKERLIISGTSGIAGAIAAKVASKTIFKTASKAAAKIVVQKGMSATAGALAGGVSSIFTSPVGGVAIGVGVGVAIDKSLLELEEAVSRDEYKAEIINTIEQERTEILNLLN